jgi:hypothetical protein
MLIKLPHPPAIAADKPQVHSLANHDAYDGTLHLPLRTRTLIYELAYSFRLYGEPPVIGKRDCASRLPRYSPSHEYHN